MAKGWKCDAKDCGAWTDESGGSIRLSIRENTGFDERAMILDLCQKHRTEFFALLGLPNKVVPDAGKAK